MTTPLRMLARGAARRCPRCGSGDLFSGYFTLRERCPGCDLGFEREEGYWLGAMVINMAVTELIFVALFVGLAVVWWPDPPWGRILVILLAVNLAVPIAFYPFSKTIWVGGDLAFRKATNEPE